MASSAQYDRSELKEILSLEKLYFDILTRTENPYDKEAHLDLIAFFEKRVPELLKQVHCLLELRIKKSSQPYIFYCERFKDGQSTKPSKKRRIKTSPL